MWKKHKTHLIITSSITHPSPLTSPSAAASTACVRAPLSQATFLPLPNFQLRLMLCMCSEWEEGRSRKRVGEGVRERAPSLSLSQREFVVIVSAHACEAYALLVSCFRYSMNLYVISTCVSCVGYLFLSLAYSLRVVWGAELNRIICFKIWGPLICSYRWYRCK